MAVPDYQTLMLPVLGVFSDGHPHTVGDVRDRLARELRLTSEELAELLPSGTQRTFDNRVSWARTYLTKAGLLRGIGRARYEITSRGLEVLNDPPERITNAFLGRFPEFTAFKRREESNSPVHDATMRSTVMTPLASSGVSDRNPEELLASLHRQVRQALADELLERVKQCRPEFFEQLVVDVLIAMGYGGSRQDAGQAVGRGGDGGIDGEINEDRLGLDKVYIQAKRWDGTVGRPVVQAFVGSLEGKRARKGVLITTSEFSREAREYIGHIEKRVVLVDGDQLADLMIEHDVGVTDVVSYAVKRVDADYFEES